MPSVLAIDIGTSSIRATVYDGRVRRIGKGSHVRTAWRASPDGSVEAHAATLERSVRAAVDGALKGTRRTIDAVGVAAFWHSLVGIDRSGRAITPVLPWADTRSAADADALRQSLDEAAVHARTGCRLHPTYWPARLRWFAAHDARAFGRVARWMSFPAYLERRWLGRDAESRSQASGTGLFLHQDSTWDEELCAACRVTPEQLGRIVDLDDTQAALRAPLAARWPALRDARWVPAAGDGAMNNVGAACVGAGRAAVMIGTSGALRLAWNTAQAPEIPFTLWRYWIDRRRVVVGGALSNGGNLVAWLSGLLGVTIDRRLEARIARMTPDGHGLSLLPFIAGERSPDYLPDARATLSGLRLATTREDIVRAALEAVAFRFAAVLAEISKVRPVQQLVATGTALSASPVWTQIMADVLGRPIEMPREDELTGRGAAVVALEQLGVAPPDGEPRITRVFRPDRRAHEIYRRAADRQQRLMRALT